jgi:hypothetical protein
MFRRKPAKGKGADKSEQDRGRGAEDATLMLADEPPFDPRSPEEATVALPMLHQEREAADASAATTVIRAPAADPNDTGGGPDVVLERAGEDQGATVAVSIPDLGPPPGAPGSLREPGTETAPMKKPEPESAATVAVSIPDFDAPAAESPEAKVGSVSETVAVPVPAMPDESAGPAATVAVSIPNFDAPDAPAPEVPSVSETVAVPMPAMPDASETADATVAVSIPNFDEDTGTTGKLATPPGAPVPDGAADATVAVSIPNFDDAGMTGRLESAAPEPYEPADDGTVAVPVPNFDDPTGSTGRIPAPPAVEDATVAAPRPSFDPEPAPGPDPSSPAPVDDATIAAAAFEEVAAPVPEPAAPVAAPPAPDSSDATRFDLPPEESTRPEVAGVMVAIDGELAGLVCPVHDGENKLGRSEACDVVLPSMKISREHATIVHQDGVFAILPLSDRNPTYVNEEVISGCELSDGDSVRMGRSTFRFRTIQGL